MFLADTIIFFSSCLIQVVPAGSVPSQESDGSSPGESGGELGPEGKTYRSKEQLMLRANSLKKALRQIIEQAEKGKREEECGCAPHPAVWFLLICPLMSSFQWWTSRTVTRRSRGCRPCPPSNGRTARSWRTLSHVRVSSVQVSRDLKYTDILRMLRSLFRF